VKFKIMRMKPVRRTNLQQKTGGLNISKEMKCPHKNSAELIATKEMQVEQGPCAPPPPMLIFLYYVSLFFTNSHYFFILAPPNNNLVYLNLFGPTQIWILAPPLDEGNYKSDIRSTPWSGCTICSSDGGQKYV
jgi:hypothetical protein